MATAVKRKEPSPSQSSNSAPLPPSTQERTTTYVRSSLQEIPRRNSNPDLKPGQVSVVNKKSMISEVDLVFTKTRDFINFINQKLAELATPQSYIRDYATLQLNEQSLIRLTKDLDDPEGLFSSEQKIELYKLLEEGFNLWRAALINKYPQIDRAKVNEITNPRKEAIKLRLEKSTKSSDEPLQAFPEATLMPAPGKKNELFRFTRVNQTPHVQDFFQTLSKQLDDLNKELVKTAGDARSYYSDNSIQHDETQLFVVVHQLFDLNCVLSADEKIILLQEVLNGFKFLNAAVIAKKPTLDQAQLALINNQRVKAIQSKIKALEKTDAYSSDSTSFPTESLLPTSVQTTARFWIAIAGLIAAGLAFVAYRRIYTKISP